MPVVGMRRTTRVFGVVKSGDGGRRLRSGRRLWSDPDVGGKLKKSNSNSPRDEWLKLLDEDDRDKVATTGWSSQVGSVRKPEAEPEFTNGGRNLVADDVKASEMKIVKVYERKRKRFDCVDGSTGFRKGRDVDRMFGNHFVRRHRKKKTTVESDDVGGECRPGLVIGCNGDGNAGWLARFLHSVLLYLVKDGINLSKLHGFLSAKPIGRVCSSHGIQFSQHCTGSGGSGLCKIFGATNFAPSFSVNFSAVPGCFMYLHSTRLLRFEKLVFTYLVNGSRKSDDRALDDSSEIVSRIPSRDHFSKRNATGLVVNYTRKKKTVHQATGGRLVARHHMQLRNSFGSSIRGKRSTPRYRGGRSVPVGGSSQKSHSDDFCSGFQKTGDDAKLIDSPVADLPCKLSGDSASVGRLEESKATSLVWSSSDPHSRPVSHKRVRRAGQSEFVRSNEETKVASAFIGEVTDSTSCAANILVIDQDKCYRQKGATVMLERSLSNRWIIVVKKDGFTKYSHMPDMVMRPCTFNRMTRDIIWTVNDGCKLEFPTREDWSIFKELYKACSSRNLEAPADKFIPVPGVHLVSNYEDKISAPYSRPEAYISVDGNEVSRVLAKRSASYDLDSDDVDWISKCNEEMRLNNESHQDITFDTFELMIDAIEKAFYFNPGANLDKRCIADFYPELGREEVLEVVYNYWLEKRKQKCPALVRVLQAHKPKQGLNIGGPVLRKKRSFKRHASQNGRGKQRFLLDVIGIRNDDVGEQLATIEVEESEASATKYSEWATHKRKRAQALMEISDLATYKAAMALKIAQAVKDVSAPDTAAAMFLILCD